MNATEPPPDDRPLPPPARLVPAIVGLSALILYLEMLLVRWIGTELRIFAYLQNGVLVAGFLGLGLGCRNARRPVRGLGAAASLVFLALVIRDPFGWQVAEAVTHGLTSFADTVIWFAEPPPAPYVRTALVAFAVGASFAVLGALALAFHPLGQWLGAWIDAHPRPVAAYTANVLGSLLGIGAFVVATVLRWPPWVWLALGAAGLVACLRHASDPPHRRAAAAGLLLSVPLVAWSAPQAGRTVWSPYQKLALEPFTVGGRPCGAMIQVNNVGYQSMLDHDPRRVVDTPELYPAAAVPLAPYVMPYRVVGPRARVLVVGAGSGNDVAAALRAGAERVHAVEIDPVIVEWGRSAHPNRPYASDRVTVTVDDARAFFRYDTGRYDLVVMGALDSHVNPSAYANVRLDHFVYTRESLQDVKRLLGPGGVLALGFDARALWIADRLVRLVQETFGASIPMMVTSEAPCLGWGGLLVLGGSPEALAPLRTRIAAEPELLRRAIPAEQFPRTTHPTTDDWPYLYLRSPGVPKYHLLVGACGLGLALVLRRRLFRAGEPVNGVMVLLGAAFMLLEVSGVSRAALLYGTTWTVNAYVVGAILAMVLLANRVAERSGGSRPAWAAPGLLVSLLALAFLPTSWLAGLPGAVRIVVGGGFLALPVFFSGLVFVTAWAKDPRRDLAFGSNLLGSLLGGVASMLSMLVGFQALTLFTLALYGAALLALRARGQ